MTTTEIREALLAVEQAVDVPPADQVAFQARVRAERRRRTAGRALVAAAAAAAVVTAGIAGNAVLGDPESTPIANTPGETATSVPQTVFFTLDNRLTALDPRGVVHDLGQYSEGVIGWTEDRLYALDDDSHITSVGRSPRSPKCPVPRRPTRCRAWRSRATVASWPGWASTTWCIATTSWRIGTDLSFAATKDSFVAGVSADGVLVASRSGISLRDAAGGVAIPVQGDLDGWASDVAGDLVVVNESLDRSSLYDVSDGTARPTETFAGSAALGPYAERVAVIVPEPADRARVEVWDGGTLMPVTGLDDVVPHAVRWADETTLLVAGGSGLYACDIDLRCGRLPVDGVPDIGE